MRHLIQAEREAFQRGRAVGRGEDYTAACDDIDRAWNDIARSVARGGPDHAELELERWGPDGREHFGDPRPEDLEPDELPQRARASWEQFGVPPTRMVHLGGVRGQSVTAFGVWSQGTAREYDIPLYACGSVAFDEDAGGRVGLGLATRLPGPSALRPSCRFARRPEDAVDVPYD